MEPIRKIASQLTRHPFIRSAIEERADLAAFRKAPTPSIIIGVLAICLSFVICWPAISLLGVLAVQWRQPWLFVIGSPVLYGGSHLLFILGMALSGAKYSYILLRWLVRIAFERFADPGPSA